MGEGGEGGCRALPGWRPRGSHWASVASRLGRGLGRSRGSHLRPDGSPGTEKPGGEARRRPGQLSPAAGALGRFWSRAGRRRRRDWQRKKEPAGNWWAGIQRRWVGLITIIIIICLMGPADSQANWTAAGPRGGGAFVSVEWVGVRAGWPALTGVLGCGASGGPGGQDPPPSASRVIRFHSWAGAGIAPPPPGSCRVRGCPSPQLWVGRLRLPPPPRSRGRTPRPQRSGQHRSPSGRSGGPHELLGVTLQCTLSALHRDPGGLPGRAPAPPRHHPGVPAVRDRGGGTGPGPRARAAPRSPHERPSRWMPGSPRGWP